MELLIFATILQLIGAGFAFYSAYQLDKKRKEVINCGKNK